MEVISIQENCFHESSFAEYSTIENFSESCQLRSHEQGRVVYSMIWVTGLVIQVCSFNRELICHKCVFEIQNNSNKYFFSFQVRIFSPQVSLSCPFVVVVVVVVVVDVKAVVAKSPLSVKEQFLATVTSSNFNSRKKRRKIPGNGADSVATFSDIE